MYMYMYMYAPAHTCTKVPCDSVIVVLDDYTYCLVTLVIAIPEMR